jgi:hypothetical protein
MYRQMHGVMVYTVVFLQRRVEDESCWSSVLMFLSAIGSEGGQEDTHLLGPAMAAVQSVNGTAHDYLCVCVRARNASIDLTL